jgi:hypothetical protein
MEAYLTKHDDPSSPVVTLTRAQFQRAAYRRKLRFEQLDRAETFARAFANRRVTFRADDGSNGGSGTGMGYLGVSHMVTEAMAADYRLTLIAKRRCEDDTRTLDQMRADTLIDLILGRITVEASNSQLDDPEQSRREAAGGAPGLDEPADQGAPISELPEHLVLSHTLGAWARPVISVTVPIQTLMGLSDEAGTLSGGTPIPADLARLIASDPASTWYRLLTDPAREAVELSTRSYAPTAPITREVQARHHTCLYPGCDRPATRCELDHPIPYNRGGTTSSRHLVPLCKRHHKVKHSPGFGLTPLGDGSYRLTTKAGTTHVLRPSQQPTADWPAGDHVTADWPAGDNATEDSWLDDDDWLDDWFTDDSPNDELAALIAEEEPAHRTRW